MKNKGDASSKPGRLPEKQTKRFQVACCVAGSRFGFRDEISHQLFCRRRTDAAAVSVQYHFPPYAGLAR